MDLSKRMRCLFAYVLYLMIVVVVCISQNSNNNKPCIIGRLGQAETQRTVALVVGGFAALGFLIASFLFLKSVLKRKGEKY